MKRSIGVALLLVFLVGLTGAGLHAQDVAAVTGVVTDVNGALVVGADITLVNTTTSATYHTTTNSLGSYTFASVPPGAGYTITISKGGFEPVVVSSVYLTVANTRTQNVKLHAGNVSTSVEVSAANDEVTINTTDATIGNNFDVNVLNDLPVQVRDTPSALFTLQAGVSASSVTGARTDQTYISVDGLDVNDISTGQTFLIVANAPVDSVEEFRGTVAGQLASSGPGGGGQFQLVTKSGTNTFHGNVNEYHRDTSTVANNWFNDNFGVPLAHYVRNQFGGQVTGPIKRDKAFFTFNFYDSRIATATSVDATVPLDSFRNGNVSYILAQPSSGTSVCSFTSRVNTTPLCIGTLTSAQVKTLDPLGIGFSPVVLSLLNSRYPHSNDPTGGDGINTGGYRFNAPEPNDETNYVGKVDFTINPTMKIFGKVGINRQNAVEFAQRFPSDPVLGNPFIDRSYDYVIGHTWTIGKDKVNQFYYGDTVEKFDFPSPYAPTGTTVLTLGAGTNFFLGNPYNEQQSQKRRLPIPMVRDDFSWQRGSHNMSVGGMFKFIKTESQQILDFNFVGVGLGGELTGLSSCLRPGGDTTTGAPPACPNSYPQIRGGSTAPALYDNAFTLALGRVASVDTNYNYNAAGKALPNGTGHIRQYRYYQTELYFNDTWKISKELTMTYGLQYQLYSVPYEVSGLESTQNTTFDTYFGTRVAQSAAGVQTNSAVPFITYNLGGKANNAAPLYSPNYEDFAPRVSFAYNPSWYQKLVINAGAGIVFDRTVTNALNFIQDQSSYLFQNSTNTQYGSASGAAASLMTDPRVGTNFSFPANTAPTITKPYTPNVSGGVPYGLGSNTFNTIIDPVIKDPYSIGINAGIQDQLPGNFILKLSYVGRLGRRLLGQADASQLIDFPDKTSGQLLSTAFGLMTTQVRAGANTANLPAQPWMEHLAAAAGPYATHYGYPNITSFLTDFLFTGLVANGDMADFIQGMAAYGFLPSNVGMDSQFSNNTFITNKGFSSYNGMLLTVDKNLSHGLRFDYNFTWAHSIDNTSLIANAIASSSGIGFICDATRPRECRGNSDFDETYVMNGNFTYNLPFGHGRMFAATTPKWVDEVIGGWDVSGIPSMHSGVAFTATSNAYIAGYANNAPAIFSGNRAAVKPHVHKNSDGTVNLYDSSTAADAAFSGPVGLNIGSRNNLRGASAWGMDAGVAKNFPLVTDRVNMKFRADAFNVFNHPTFGLPANDITEASGVPFGQISATTGAPRVVQLALRVEF